MGEIRKRERNGRVSYLARHYGPEGRKVSKSFDRRKDATDWLTTVENSKLTGSYVDPNRSKITVKAWAERWIASKVNLAPKTRDRYEGIIRAHVEPRWGKVQLAKVTHAEVQRWIAGIDAAPATVKKVHRVMSMLMAYAVADDRLARNPADKISLPRVRQAEKRFLTHQQVHDLAEAVAAEYRLVVLFLAYTGLRWGEMAALRVHRLDFLRRRALVAESVTPVKGVMTFGPTKAMSAARCHSRASCSRISRSTSPVRRPLILSSPVCVAQLCVIPSSSAAHSTKRVSGWAFRGSRLTNSGTQPRHWRLHRVQISRWFSRCWATNRRP
jgi:hypothetical protein